MTRTRSLAAALAALLAPAVGAAQEAAASAAAVTQFEPGLEEMKYRHLWLAYGAIWLVIMALVWRTSRRQAELKQDLAALQGRVDEMEKNRE